MTPWVIHRFEDVSSTMDTARELLPHNSKGRFVVLAQEQTQGRGRQQRAWSSPKGNLYTTLVVPVTNFETAPLYSYIAALAAHQALATTLQDAATVSLKWPNDLLINSEKAGGILLELEQTPQGLMLLVGIGMNLVAHPDNTPYPATNLKDHSVHTTPEEILPKILSAFDQCETLFTQKGFEPLRQAWLKNRDPAHSQLTLKSHEHGTKLPITGAFHDLDTDGLLVLEITDPTGQKNLKKFSTGDVFFS